MKKKVFGKKLGRESATRRALFRSLIKELVLHGKIVTTKTKAKAITPDVEKLVRLAKSKDINAARRMSSYLGNDRKTLNILVSNAGKIFKDRKSGFTKFINLPRRKGDYAEMVALEWSEKIVEESTKAKKSAKSSKIKDVKGNIVNKEGTDESPDKNKKKSLKDRISALRKKKSV